MTSTIEPPPLASKQGTSKTVEGFQKSPELARQAAQTKPTEPQNKDTNASNLPKPQDPPASSSESTSESSQQPTESAKRDITVQKVTKDKTGAVNLDMLASNQDKVHAERPLWAALEEKSKEAVPSLVIREAVPVKPPGGKQENLDLVLAASVPEIIETR